MFTCYLANWDNPWNNLKISQLNIETTSYNYWDMLIFTKTLLQWMNHQR
jgi:hypothetical protein